jgi:hypothetical protein
MRPSPKIKNKVVNGLLLCPRSICDVKLLGVDITLGGKLDVDFVTRKLPLR